MLNELTIVADKGINIAEYDLSVSEKGVKTLKKNGTDLKKADNGMYYLPKGSYEITVMNNDGAATTSMEVK